MRPGFGVFVCLFVAHATGPNKQTGRSARVFCLSLLPTLVLAFPRSFAYKSGTQPSSVAMRHAIDPPTHTHTHATVVNGHMYVACVCVWLLASVLARDTFTRKCR